MSDVYLVDDHTMLRDGLKAVLEDAGHRVVGESADPTSALAEILGLGPAVVLLDLHLGLRTGFELLEQLAQRKANSRVIMLTMSAQPRHVAEAISLGACGYVLKGSPAREVLDAVEAVVAGNGQVGAPVVAPLAVAGRSPADDGNPLARLSERERQVIELVVQGHTSAAIGEQLHLSPKTVESYRSRLMAKLGVSDLPALVRLAIREGLISADDV